MVNIKVNDLSCKTFCAHNEANFVWSRSKYLSPSFYKICNKVTSQSTHTIANDNRHRVLVTSRDPSRHREVSVERHLEKRLKVNLAATPRVRARASGQGDGPCGRVSILVIGTGRF